MSGESDFAGLLAAGDGEAIIGLIIFLITIVSWAVNQVTNKKRKVPPVANRPRPPVRPRDQKLQEEISIFMQEAAGRKPGANRPARPGAAATAPPKRPLAAAKPPARRSKPGAEIASRQAPVTGTLGSGVQQHLSEYMANKVTQQAQQRLAPRVDEKIAQDLGAPVTTGAARRAEPAAIDMAAPRGDKIADALRNPASLRQAIVLNMILARPGRPGSRSFGR